jgi:hypothetical protein
MTVLLIGLTFLVWIAIISTEVILLRSSQYRVLKLVLPSFTTGCGAVLICWIIASILRADSNR